MKKFFLVLSAILLATFLFSFFIVFDGNPSKLFLKWQSWTRDRPSLPFSAYKTRRVKQSNIEWEQPNKILFVDKHLFWKGRGARALPELNSDGQVVSFIIVDGGYGYSEAVKAIAVGIHAEGFSLGNPTVENGKIKSLPILVSSTWNQEPLAFLKDETEPFSGIAETILPSGQIILETPFLMGKYHGNVLKYTRQGIPVFSKEFINGKKHGTHIFWFQDPLDPDDYKPTKSRSGDLLPSLWAKVKDDAVAKFGSKNIGSGDANKWIVKTYRLKGGEFQVQLLEHWKNNVRHGLFEGFDYLGNKTFKDEYKSGLRIKHKIFDKTKG